MTPDLKSSLKSSSVGFYRYHDVILGKGNFATVYLARHKVIGCEVALKVINTAEIKEEYLKKNLDREAYILRSLQHPNIIRLYEVIKSANLYCLSLEVIRGVSLYQYMMNLHTHRISERLARIFFYQMLSGVEYMHRVHVIHRDLKLENILVEFGHIVKIVDFGLSNVYYPTFILRTHCGSMEYAAPELFRSVYGTAADVWSLGVILYAMVVGRMPFKFCQKNDKEDKTIDNEDFSLKKERFVKRISKGLMQENWELMEKLSSECWNLLHEMLQPDQFSRIHMEHAISHSWILKDENLKTRLPQSRRDLERKFHSEIVYYLALKLNTSTSRIEKHIKFHPFDKISAMFYIARDILVKEVLHPPQRFKSSFLYRFECWRQNRSSLYSIEQNRDYVGREMYQKYDPATNKEKVSPKYNVASKVTDKNKTSSTSTTLNNSKHYPNESNSSPRPKNEDNRKEREKSPLKISRKFVTFETIDADSNKAPQIVDQKQVTRNAYRSYKNSRPKAAEFLKSEDKSKQSDEKHQTENRLAGENQGENLCENVRKLFQFAEKKVGDCERLEKLSENITLHGERHVIPHSVEPVERISKIVTKSKSTERKSCGSNCIEVRNRCSEGTQAKSAPFSDSAKSFRRRSRKATEESSRSRRNSSNPPESVESQVERNNISLLTRSYQPSNISKDNKEDILKNSELSSRTHIQNFKFVKSSPYTERKVSSKRTTFADRISLCQGDTKE